jgi:hypothetical protein
MSTREIPSHSKKRKINNVKEFLWGMAMIEAAAAEYKWLVSLVVDSKFIKGARYVDDGVVFFMLWISLNQSLFHAMNLSKPIAFYRDLLTTSAYVGFEQPECSSKQSS